ncbi:hypothetical protein [Streptomyces sp. NPDC088400]|uniref:hypothetical protein n=1 Tax=Streptomyces sp. NPDC088400 TaxID=3365861 RepID=UPI00382CD1D3
MTYTPFRMLGFALIAFSVVGCTVSEAGSDDAERNSKVNMQEAAEKADAVVFKTLSMVDPPLQWTHDTSSGGGCTDFKNDSHGYGSTIRNAVVMTQVSEERRGALLGVIERNWKEDGYKITSVNSDKDSPAIYAKTGDGFGMSLIVGYKGQFFLKVQTPCVKKSDVADPATKANGHDYYGNEVPRPSVHDAFWSSSTPISSASPSES